MDSKSSQSQFWRLSPDMFRKRGGRSSNYDTAEGFSGKPRCSVIKTHVRSVRNLRETEHFSGEFPNGSSADATGSNWRFQAENLRQITIYQLMKPLKFIPTPPPPPVLAAPSLTSGACAPRSRSGLSHRLIASYRVTTLGRGGVGVGGGGA